MNTEKPAGPEGGSGGARPLTYVLITAASNEADLIESTILSVVGQTVPPAAESLLRRAPVIPCHYRLTRKDKAHIVESVNRGWKMVAKS